MIRRLMASSAVIALMTTGAFGVAQAQTQPAEQPAQLENQQTPTGTATEAQDPATQGQDAAAGQDPAAEGQDAAQAGTQDPAAQPADTAQTGTQDPAAQPADTAQTEPADPAMQSQDAAQTQPTDPAAEPADTAQTEEPASAGASTQTAASGEATLTPEEPTIASAFMGQSVFSSEDPEADNIGEVQDLIISEDGGITHAVIGVGGFLGIGQKSVAVPFDELQVVEQEGEVRLIYAANREQLEAAEEFDRTAYDPQARNQQEVAAQQAAGGGMGAGGVAPVPAPAGGGMTAAPAEEPEAEEPADMAAAPAEEPAEEPADAAAVTAPETETETAATAETDPQADPAAENQAQTEPNAVTGTEVTTDTATTQDPAAQTQDTAQTETLTVPVQTTEGAAETQPAAGAEQQTAASGAAGGEAGFMSFEANQVRASTLIGQEIYGAEEESIGEVSDLVMQTEGETRAAIVDVGGFLGVGEKSVAIPFDQIEVQPGAEGEEPRLMVAMTREELEQAPAWEDPAQQAAAGAEQTTPPTTEQQTAAGTDPSAAPIEQPAEQQTAAGGEQQPAEFQTATQDMSAENLMGQAIYSPEDEQIGEVGDVVFDPSGSIQAVVVDVGGFLGIGEKSVAIQYDALNVRQDQNGEVRLMVNATQEQLENAPSYDVEAQTAPQ